GTGIPVIAAPLRDAPDDPARQELELLGRVLVGEVDQQDARPHPLDLVVVLDQPRIAVGPAGPVRPGARIYRVVPGPGRPGCAPRGGDPLGPGRLRAGPTSGRIVGRAGAGEQGQQAREPPTCRFHQKVFRRRTGEDERLARRHATTPTSARPIPDSANDEGSGTAVSVAVSAIDTMSLTTRSPDPPWRGIVKG